MGLYYRLDFKKNTSQQINNEEVRSGYRLLLQWEKNQDYH